MTKRWLRLNKNFLQNCEDVETTWLYKRLETRMHYWVKTIDMYFLSVPATTASVGLQYHNQRLKQKILVSGQNMIAIPTGSKVTKRACDNRKKGNRQNAYARIFY